MQTKVCNKCKIEKEISEFYKFKHRKFGVLAKCKECFKSLKTKSRALIPLGFKICTRCHKQKALSDFAKEKCGRFGRSSICKECRGEEAKIYNLEHKEEKKQKRQDNKDKRRNYIYRRLYGITLDEYNNMFQDQSGVCAICGKEETSIEYRTNKKRLLAVDHNHNTGKIRELLCVNCNRLISCDNTEILQNAINYLNKHKE